MLAVTNHWRSRDYVITLVRGRVSANVGTGGERRDVAAGETVQSTASVRSASTRKASCTVERSAVRVERGRAPRHEIEELGRPA
jgi:hypothetical protein